MKKEESGKELYESYRQHMRKLTDVRSALALMQWDQETYLPSKGSNFRAQQVATLSEMAHELASSDKFGFLLDSLQNNAELSEMETKNILLSHEDYLKQKKYEPAFVRKMSEAVSKSFNAWNMAKKENRFSLFKNELAELVELKKEETQILGYTEHPYDALMNEFEKGCTVNLMDKIFGNMLPNLRSILDKIQQANPTEDSFLFQKFDKKSSGNLGSG